MSLVFACTAIVYLLNGKKVLRVFRKSKDYELQPSDMALGRKNFLADSMLAHTIHLLPSISYLDTDEGMVAVFKEASQSYLSRVEIPFTFPGDQSSVSRPT